MYKIKKGDLVIIRSGRDKNRQGKVKKLLVKENRALVEGLHMVVKHKKAAEGGTRMQESPISLSAIALYNPNRGKADKVVIKTTDSGKKARYFKSDGTPVDLDGK